MVPTSQSRSFAYQWFASSIIDRCFSKARNLRSNPTLAFVIGGVVAGDERTVQYEGIADQPSGAELERLKAVYYRVYPDGPTRISWPGLIYVRVRPTWIRYTDYTVDPTEILEFSAKDLDS